MFWKWTKRIGLGFIGIVGLVIVGGMAYQKIGTMIDRKKYPPMGQMVDVGGYRMHINHQGTLGPTVVLDAGLGCNSLDWHLVQTEIAKLSKQCSVASIDRPGNGWSDPSPLPRTSSNIVEEMHTLLNKSGIPKPYILVGHSFGGLNVRLYATRYPDEVAGIILVDAAHEDQDKDFPDEFNSRNTTLSSGLLSMANLGILRACMNLPQAKQNFAQFPEDIRDRMIAKRTDTTFIRTAIEESSKLGESYEQVRKAKIDLGNKPLIVISAGKPVTKEQAPEISQELLDQVNQAQANLQKKLVNESTRSKHIIAKNSGHMIPQEEPQVIVDAIQEMLQMVNEVN